MIPVLDPISPSSGDHSLPITRQPMTLAKSNAHGFLLLDKAEGDSSFKALFPVKRLFRGQKVGHAGTLDPAATGLLLVAIGNATRLLEFIEGMPKVYRFDLQLGVTTDTYDQEGEVLATQPVPTFTDLEFDSVLKHYIGRIQQKPPAYSAIKIQGKRACDRVRSGETVDIPAREIEVFDLKRVAREGDCISLELFCSKGTYVRTLAHDIGQQLGCGGIATHIRRLRIGPFDIADAKTEAQLTGLADLVPLASAMNHLPGVQLLEKWVGPLLNGNGIPPIGYAVLGPNELTPDAGLFRVMDKAGNLLALAEINPLRQLVPRKVLNSK